MMIKSCEQIKQNKEGINCTKERDWGYDSNGAKSNAKGCRFVSLAVSVRLRGGPRPSRSGTYRRG